MTSFLFDLDGTLTLNGKHIDPKFAIWFSNFQKTHDTYLVTGTEYQSVTKQLNTDIVQQFKMIFTCSGNEVRENGKVIHTEKWIAPTDLLDELNHMLAQSRCPRKTGSHIVQRSGLVSFSTVGRNSNSIQRSEYIQYDTASGERESICARLSAKFPELEIVVVGDLGLDIYPLGKGKNQIIGWIKDRPLIFYGDKTKPGGNDFPLATVVELTHQVDDWTHTWDLLRIIITP